MHNIACLRLCLLLAEAMVAISDHWYQKAPYTVITSWHVSTSQSKYAFTSKIRLKPRTNKCSCVFVRIVSFVNYTLTNWKAQRLLILQCARSIGTNDHKCLHGLWDAGRITGISIVWGNKHPSLTHICLVDFSILIKWMSLFPVLGVSGVLFHFYSIFYRNSC